MRTKVLSGVFLLSGGMLLAGAAVGAQDAAQPGPPVRKLELKFNNGLVTLKAQNVSIRDILTEWAKQCDCQVIGADKITNSPLAMPVQYESQPEAAILKSLLNPGVVSGGYFQLPRNPGETGASAFSSLRIMPVSHFTAATYSQSSSAMAAPLMSNTDDELPPVPNIPAMEANQPPPQNRPTTPSLPPGVIPISGVPTVGPGGRATGPGTPTVPPTVPPNGGRGGGF